MPNALNFKYISALIAFFVLCCVQLEKVYANSAFEKLKSNKSRLLNNYSNKVRTAIDQSKSINKIKLSIVGKIKPSVSGVQAEIASQEFADQFIKNEYESLGLLAKESTISTITDKDENGELHVKHKIKYNGIEIDGAYINYHMNSDGSIYYISSKIIEINDAMKNASVNKYLSYDDIINTVDKMLLENFDKAKYNINYSNLVIIEDNPYVVWKLDISIPKYGARFTYYINATTGVIIKSIDTVRSWESEQGSGYGQLTNYNDIDATKESVFWRSGYVYRLMDSSRLAYSIGHYHPGLMASPSETYIRNYYVYDYDNSWSYPENSPAGTSFTSYEFAEAIDAHVNGGHLYDYLMYLGLNSYDNGGHPLYSNIVPCSQYNAFWDGYGVSYCNYINSSFSAALDVVGHEWAHALTEKSPKGRIGELTYSGLSGALNESFSDCLGTAFETKFGIQNWTLGERIYTHRSMQSPNSYNQPDYYKGIYWFPVDNCTPSNINDYCGVHTNSGVPNKMFYLLAQGGVHPISKLSVQGIGIDKAIKIMLRANRYYWPSDADFVDAYDGMVLAANYLYPNSSLESDQVTRAWTAVGLKIDRDNDNVLDINDNCIEMYNPDQKDTDKDGIGDACDSDYDNDGILDAYEDNDNDGMNDGWEIAHGLNRFDPTDAYNDNDNDGLINLLEYRSGTNPNSTDTDSDGTSDTAEYYNNSITPVIMQLLID